jgi:hypothetical protein
VQQEELVMYLAGAVGTWKAAVAESMCEARLSRAGAMADAALLLVLIRSVAGVHPKVQVDQLP